MKNDDNKKPNDKEKERMDPEYFNLFSDPVNDLTSDDETEVFENSDFFDFQGKRGSIPSPVLPPFFWVIVWVIISLLAVFKKLKNNSKTEKKKN